MQVDMERNGRRPYSVPALSNSGEDMNALREENRRAYGDLLTTPNSRRVMNNNNNTNNNNGGGSNDKSGGGEQTSLMEEGVGQRVNRPPASSAERLLNGGSKLNGGAVTTTTAAANEAYPTLSSSSRAHGRSPGELSPRFAGGKFGEANDSNLLYVPSAAACKPANTFPHMASPTPSTLPFTSFASARKPPSGPSPNEGMYRRNSSQLMLPGRSAMNTPTKAMLASARGAMQTASPPFGMQTQPHQVVAYLARNGAIFAMPEENNLPVLVHPNTNSNVNSLGGNGGAQHGLTHGNPARSTTYNPNSSNLAHAVQGTSNRTLCAPFAAPLYGTSPSPTNTSTLIAPSPVTAATLGPNNMNARLLSDRLEDGSEAPPGSYNLNGHTNNNNNNTNNNLAVSAQQGLNHESSVTLPPPIERATTARPSYLGTKQRLNSVRSGQGGNTPLSRPLSPHGDSFFANFTQPPGGLEGSGNYGMKHGPRGAHYDDDTTSPPAERSSATTSDIPTPPRELNGTRRAGERGDGDGGGGATRPQRALCAQSARATSVPALGVDAPGNSYKGNDNIVVDEEDGLVAIDGGNHMNINGSSARRGVAGGSFAEKTLQQQQHESTTNTTSSVFSAETPQVDEVAEAALAALQHIPEAWSRALLRAVTLQTITEHVPMGVLGPTFCFDAYMELRGEFATAALVMQQPPQQPQPMLGAMWDGAPGVPRGGSGERRSPYMSPAFGQPSSSPQSCQTGMTLNASRHVHNSLASSLCHSLDPRAVPSGTAALPGVSLLHLQTVAPALLRFRINNAKKVSIDETRARYEQLAAQQQKQQQEQQEALAPGAAMWSPRTRVVVPSRAEIALSLLRPHLTRDVVFGAQLVQRMPRVMHAGSRLFLPQPPPQMSNGNGSMTDNVVMGNNSSCNSVNNRSAAPTRSASPGRSPMRLLIVPSLSPGHQELTYAAVSFEAMPSIFLKRQQDELRQERNSSGSGHRRRVVTPFFEREFVATLASGNDAACLFATTLAPEFLVGLPSFLHHPMRALTSAIRATLHRFYNLLTAEMLMGGGGAATATSGSRHNIRAPALDLALLYLRGGALYYSSTAGLEGRLFYLNHSAGAARPVLNLSEEVTLLAGSLNMESSRCSATSLVSLPGTAYEMPSLTRCHIDLNQLVSLAGEGAEASLARRSELTLGSGTLLGTKGWHDLESRVSHSVPPGIAAANVELESANNSRTQAHHRTFSSSVNGGAGYSYLNNNNNNSTSALGVGANTSVIPELAVVLSGGAAVAAAASRTSTSRSAAHHHNNNNNNSYGSDMGGGSPGEEPRGSFGRYHGNHSGSVTGVEGAGMPQHHQYSSKENMSSNSNAAPAPKDKAAALPHAVVLATSEFWELMPSHVVSDLLRVMLLLHSEAALLTRDVNLALNAANAERRQREVTVRTAVQEQYRLVQHYIHSLPVFAAATQQRLEQFYLNMIFYYLELDERSTQTVQQRLHEDLRQLAARRRGGKASDVVSTPGSPRGRGTPRDETNGTSASTSGGGGGGGAAAGTLLSASLYASLSNLAGSHSAGAGACTMPPRSLCDAMASVLSAEAVVYARSEGSVVRRVNSGSYSNTNDNPNSISYDLAQLSSGQTCSVLQGSRVLPPPRSGDTHSESEGHECKTGMQSPISAELPNELAQDITAFSVVVVLLPNSEGAQATRSGSSVSVYARNV